MDGIKAIFYIKSVAASNSLEIISLTRLNVK
jgi:hypothetical protein